MNNWEKFSETPLLEKEDIYRHLKMVDIIDEDYAHVKRVCKDLKKKLKSIS